MALNKTIAYLSDLENRLQEFEKDSQRSENPQDYLKKHERALENIAEYATQTLDRVYGMLRQIDSSKYTRYSLLNSGMMSVLPVVGQADYPIKISIPNSKKHDRAVGALFLDSKLPVALLSDELIGLTSDDQLKILDERRIKYLVIRQ